jgi:hypothetical protein
MTASIMRSGPQDTRELFVTQPDVRAILEQLDAWLAQLGQWDTPALRGVRRSLSRTLAKAGPSLVLAVADALVQRGSWAE